MEITNRFCLLSPKLVYDALLLGHSIVPDSSSRIFTGTAAVVFDQTSSEGDSGMTWNQTFRAVTSDKTVLQFNGAHLHPAFYMSDGSLRVMGTHDSCPIISVTPYNGGRYLVQATFETPEALSL